MPLTVEIRRRTPRHRNRHRWPIYAVVLAVVVVVLLSTPLWAANFFRQNIVDLVAYRIDRPTEIGRLTIELSPSPSVVFHDVRIGHPEFNARADRVLIEISPAPLTRRNADIRAIRIEGLVWTIPERPGDLASEISALKILPGKGRGKWNTSIAKAYAEDARVVIAGQDEPVLVGNVEVHDLLSDEITLTVNAAAPVAGETAKLTGAASFLKQRDEETALAIKGTASLTDVDSRAFVDEDIVPNTQLDFASIEFVRTGVDRVTIEMSGDSFPASAEAAEVEALTGAFKATALWDDGATNVRIHEWRASGFKFTGDIGVDQVGAVTTAIEQGVANAAGIEAYFKLRPLAKYTVKPNADAQLSVEDLRFRRAPDGNLTLQDGDATFAGVDLLVEDGAQAFAGFSGNVSIADNIINLNNIAGDGLMVNGAIVPNFAEETFHFDLSGDAELTPERLSGFVALDQIREATGRIEITRLSGTAKADGRLPDDLIIEGNLLNGRFQIESPDWSDTLENATVTFSAANDRIMTTASAQSTMLDAVRADGMFFSKEKRWTGKVSGNLASVELPNVEGKTGDVAKRIFEAFGESDLEVIAAISGEQSDRLTFDVTLPGENPSLAAQVDFQNIEDAWTLNDVSVTANLPSRVLTPLIIESVVPTGPMHVVFNRSGTEKRFRADVDLSAANMVFGKHIAKQAGASFSLSIEGGADEDAWAAETVDVAILDTNVRGTLDGDRFTVDPLNVDVAALAPLLREGGTASGQITGSIRTSPNDIDLTLQQVRLALSEDLVADNIDGRLRITDDGVEADELRVNAANSEFTLNLRESDDRWSGGISGRQVDANALMALIESFQAPPGGKTESMLLTDAKPVESGQSLLAAAPEDPPDLSAPIQDDTQPIASPGITGEFDVSVDTLLYKKAALTNVQTRVVASDGNYSATKLSFVPGAGTVTGNVRYSRGEPPHGNRVIADLVFDDVDAKIIDDLAFEKPRKLKGVLDGNVMLSVPMGDEGVELGGVNGSLQLSGTDGTLGSLGFANAVLFVFKTTEILFLRSPFGENGLSFKQLEGKASIENGRITLGVFEEREFKEAIVLQRPSYRMSAIGWVDLDQWNSEVFVHMQPLSSVADAARIFKIDEVEAINSRGGIRIRMTGPPDDPKTEIAFGGPVQAITDELRGGFRSVQGLVKDQIIDGIGGLLRGLLER